MKFSLKIFFVFLFLFAENILAQSILTVSKTPLLKFCSFSFASGGTVVGSKQSDSSEFQTLVKKDAVALHPDLSFYTREKRPPFSNGREISLAVNFKVRAANGIGYRERMQLSFAIKFSRQSFLSTSYRYSRGVRFDTLSGSSGVLYLDSIFDYTKEFSYSLKQVGVEAAALFNTNPEKNIGLYGGLSFTQYFSTSSFVALTETEETKVEQMNSSGQSSIYGGKGNKPSKQDPTITKFDALSALTTRLGIPIGFTVRLAKTKPVLKNIQFFFESKPGVAITFVSGYKSFVRPWFTAGGGIKILFY